MTANTGCKICLSGHLHSYRVVDSVRYYQCGNCRSIIADGGFRPAAVEGSSRDYDDSYWEAELTAAHERGYGSSLIRVGELFLYARRPLRRLLDVSCGAGSLLTATSEILPEISDMFWGVEPFPPAAPYRTSHPNYRVGFLDSINTLFDGGFCIEVIEHLSPDILEQMIANLARIAAPMSCWYFNSSQPSFVENHDPGYLDPHVRGHVASYSVKGLEVMFARHGFKVSSMPGRDWCFLAEKTGHAGTLPDWDGRIWNALPENKETLRRARFGSMLLTAGLESARCYLETARSNWAVGELRAHKII